jgi:hypothetical protein
MALALSLLAAAAEKDFRAQRKGSVDPAVNDL